MEMNDKVTIKSDSIVIRLLPDQVSDYWTVLEKTLIKALPENVVKNERAMEGILISLLSGTLVCWVMCRKKGEGSEVIGACITAVGGDLCSGTKDLLLYAVATDGSSNKRDWLVWFTAVKKYAIGEGCKRVTAYTDNPGVVTMWKAIKGNITQYLTVDVT